MQQRRLRLGDILDDYCPRERRITNHAVVAMIEDQVKQTRCTTCDADHEYKEARVPASRRRKDAAAQSDALDEGPRAVKARVEPPVADVMVIDEEPLLVSDLSDVSEPLEDAVAAADSTADDTDEQGPLVDDDGPVHRRLIRATLPRPEGQAPEWKEPDFTARYPGRQGREADGNRAGGQGGHGQRPGRRRAGRGAGHGAGHSAGAGGGQSRFGAQRQGNARHGGHGGPGHQNGNRGNSRGPSSRGGEHRGGPGRKRGR